MKVASSNAATSRNRAPVANSQVRAKDKRRKPRSLLLPKPVSLDHKMAKTLTNSEEGDWIHKSPKESDSRTSERTCGFPHVNIQLLRSTVENKCAFVNWKISLEPCFCQFQCRAPFARVFQTRSFASSMENWAAWGKPKQSFRTKKFPSQIAETTLSNQLTVADFGWK